MFVRCNHQESLANRNRNEIQIWSSSAQDSIFEEWDPNLLTAIELSVLPRQALPLPLRGRLEARLNPAPSVLKSILPCIMLLKSLAEGNWRFRTLSVQSQTRQTQKRIKEREIKTKVPKYYCHFNQILFMVSNCLMRLLSPRINWKGMFQDFDTFWGLSEEWEVLRRLKLH